jgi:hypothetical protein
MQEASPGRQERHRERPVVAVRVMRNFTPVAPEAALLQGLVTFTEDHRVGGPSVAFRDERRS